MAFNADVLQIQPNIVPVCMIKLDVNYVYPLKGMEYVMLVNSRRIAANAYVATVQQLIVQLMITLNQLTNIRFIAETSRMRAL